MRRLLTILLLLVLPLQFSWAAAAAYCQHGSVSDRQGHVGHHEHHHAPDTSPDAGTPAPDGTGDTDTRSGLDEDCAFCHFGCGKTVSSPPAWLEVAGEASFAPAAIVPVAPPRPPRIERPNWRAG